MVSIWTGKIVFPAPVNRRLVTRLRFGFPVPHQPAYSAHSGRIWSTHLSLFHFGFYLSLNASSSLSGHKSVMKKRTDGVHYREPACIGQLIYLFRQSREPINMRPRRDVCGVWWRRGHMRRGKGAYERAPDLRIYMCSVRRNPIAGGVISLTRVRRGCSSIIVLWATRVCVGNLIGAVRHEVANHSVIWNLVVFPWIWGILRFLRYACE